MILAGIDIGTNTLRLLVAQTGPDSFRELYSDRKITRLGQDLDRTGRLSPDAEERSLKALADFSKAVRRLGACHAASVGTSALRNASNSSAFLEKVKSRAELEVRVISGEEEARLTLLGIARALRGAAGTRDDILGSALVIDVGGGSTELVATRPGTAPETVSLPLGAVYLTERIVRHDPPTRDELEELGRAVRTELDRHDRPLRAHTADILIGTAGTVTTLAAMAQGLGAYEPEKINRYTLTKETVDSLAAKLGARSLRERRTLSGLEQGREDIILAGAVVVRELMERSGFPSMLVSDWGLREGIVLDLYRNSATNAQYGSRSE